MSRNSPQKSAQYSLQKPVKTPKIPPKIETYPPIQRSSTILWWAYRLYECKFDPSHRIRSIFGIFMYCLAILFPVCLLAPAVLYLTLVMGQILSNLISIGGYVVILSAILFTVRVLIKK